MLLTRKHFEAFEHALAGTPAIRVMSEARVMVRERIQDALEKAITGEEPVDGLITAWSCTHTMGRFLLRDCMEMEEPAGPMVAEMLMVRATILKRETPPAIVWKTASAESIQAGARWRILLRLLADAVWLDVIERFAPHNQTNTMLVMLDNQPGFPSDFLWARTTRANRGDVERDLAEFLLEFLLESSDG